MPSLTNEHITQFQALYLARFGVALTTEQALDKGTQLLHFFATVLRQNARTGSKIRPNRTGRVITSKEITL